MSYKKVVANGKLYYGQHFMCRVDNCGEEILSTEKIKEFMRELVPAIDMKPFGEPQAFRFGEGDEVGISGFQLIYTSNIAIHTNDMSRELYFDLFSCKEFDVGVVTARLEAAFSGKVVNVLSLVRE